MRFVFKLLVTMLIAVLLVLPAFAYTGTVSFEPQSINVNVGSIFTVDVQTSGPPQYTLGIHLIVVWDSSQIHATQIDFHLGSCHFSTGFPKFGEGTLEIEAIKDSTPPYLTGANTWATMEFQCVGAGVSYIGIGLSSHWILVSVDEPFSTVNFATCNQRNPVGGEMIPVNKLSVLAPYSIGIFSIIAVAAVIVKKKLT